MDIEEDNEIVDNFISNVEDSSISEKEENSDIYEIIDHSYNLTIYNFNYVYSYFTKYIKYSNCNCTMIKVKETSFFDN